MSPSEALQVYAENVRLTKVEIDGLCALKGATAESSVGGTTADDPRALRLKKTPDHTLVYPHSLRLCIAHLLYFFPFCK